MENATYIALSRQSALWRRLDLISNNLSNTNTHAYKGEHMLFKQHLENVKNDRRMGSQVADTIAFVTDYGSFRDTREGPMTSTGNPLDVAIRGQGYFVVDTPEGVRYSRNGHLRLDESGQIVTADGHALMSTVDQPFFVAPNESQISIARDGTVSTENGQLGKIRVVYFDNEQLLKKVQGGLYETRSQPQDIERPDIVQGMVEESNIQPVIEITNMIDVLRSYQAVQKVIESEHENQRKAIELFGRAQR